MYKGYELPQYTVLEKFGNIEIRGYAPHLIAEVEVAGKREQSIQEGFRILAGYIFGGNLSKQKISMTTPVVQIPVLGYWKVDLMMPSAYTLETLPQAKDKRIMFKNTPAGKMLVIKFSGLMSEKNLSRHLFILDQFVKEHSYKVQGPHRYSFYDAPWTLPFMRRNEIAYEIT